jgi:hypothetical protein
VSVSQTRRQVGYEEVVKSEWKIVEEVESAEPDKSRVSKQVRQDVVSKVILILVFPGNWRGTKTI